MWKREAEGAGKKRAEGGGGEAQGLQGHLGREASRQTSSDKQRADE